MPRLIEETRSEESLSEGRKGLLFSFFFAGGLMAATFATLFVLPSLFSMIQKRVSTASASLDPTDPHSSHYGQEM
jgi:hypothetical protein